MLPRGSEVIGKKYGIGGVAKRAAETGGMSVRVLESHKPGSEDAPHYYYYYYYYYYYEYYYYYYEYCC